MLVERIWRKYRIYVYENEYNKPAAEEICNNSLTENTTQAAMRLRTRRRRSIHKLPKICEFTSGIGILSNAGRAPQGATSTRSPAPVRRRSRAKRARRIIMISTIQRGIACRGRSRRRASATHDSAAVASETSDGVYSLPRKIEGPGPDCSGHCGSPVSTSRNGHLTAAVVDLAAHGSVGKNLRVWHEEVIAVAFTTRKHRGLRSRETTRTSRRSRPSHGIPPGHSKYYLRGTRLHAHCAQYAANNKQ